MADPGFTIRAATEADLTAVLQVERAAFGENDEADLVRTLLADPTAQPTISLLAWEGEQAVGHILITAATLEGIGEGARCSLLAPLAVIPDRQRSGIGAALTRAAVDMARAMGLQLMFVLGHPSYYPRLGFVPAGELGFDTPYPIPPENAPAWMVQELVPGRIGEVRGKVIPAETFRRPEIWRE